MNIHSISMIALLAVQSLSLSACGGAGADTTGSTSGTGRADSTSSAGGSKLALEVFTSTEETYLVDSTILSGEESVVVIDAQFTRSNAERLADKIVATGKKLTTIFITHAHPDHAFGLEILKKRFPAAHAVARPDVVTELAASWQAKTDQWKPVYKDDLTDTMVLPEPFTADTIDLDGHTLKILGPMQGDVSPSYAVHVPELHAVIAGDIVYNGTHVWLADTTPEQRAPWLETLKQIEALSPEIVVAGHKDPSLADGIAALTQTSAYIEDFVKSAGESKTAAELEQKMLGLHGSLKLPVILKYSAGAAFAGAH